VGSGGTVFVGLQGRVLASHKLAAQHFADGGFGYLGDEHVLARPLEVGQIGGAAVRVQRLRIQRDAVVAGRAKGLSEVRRLPAVARLRAGG